MLRLLSGCALVLTALFSTAAVALSREWEAPAGMDEEWQVVFTEMLADNEFAGYMMNLDGSNIQPLILEGSQIYSPDCSPDGNHLTLMSLMGRVYVSASGGDDLYQINLDTLSVANVTVSNNGREVLLVGTTADYGFGTFLVTTESFLEIGDRLPARRPESYFAYDLSPDGSAIAFNDLSSRNVYLVHVDGTVLMHLSGAIGPVWSPDGSTITFSADWDGSFNIYIMDVGRLIIVQLTHDQNPIWNLSPSWSPDGQQIMFISQADIPRNASIYMMNTDGTNQRLLTKPSRSIVRACLLTARPESLVSDS